MAGPYLSHREEFGPAIKGAYTATVSWPWGHFFFRNWLVAGRDTSPIDRVSGSGLSRAWVLFEPPPPPATERFGPGIGIQFRIECLLTCDALTPVQSYPMCTYPDVLLYILSFPCYRVARIQKRFVT